MYKRLLSVPDRSFFLFGVRGVGKSTWVDAALGGAVRINLLQEALFHNLLLEPGLFRQLLSEVRRGDWVVVDEIQRIPNLLNEVHGLIEERGARFALIGSSARKLKAAGVNLLAGRALNLSMYPLTPHELGAEFELDKVLKFGSIPLIWCSSNPQSTLQSYTELYLREEIRAEGLVRNLGGFVRFLPIAALMHGQELNVSGIARDAGVARSTVEGYLAILEDSLLTFRLPGYTPRLKVRERRGSKLYWVDPGLVRATKRQFGEITEEERGSLFEGWVLTLLRTYNLDLSVFHDIHYWSPTNSKTEVDFILRLNSSLLALEVKSSRRFNSRLLKGLRAIADLPNLEKRILVYRGEMSFRTDDGIHVWTVNDFIDRLHTKRIWD